MLAGRNLSLCGVFNEPPCAGFDPGSMLRGSTASSLAWPLILSSPVARVRSSLPLCFVTRRFLPASQSIWDCSAPSLRSLKSVHADDRCGRDGSQLLTLPASPPDPRLQLPAFRSAPNPPAGVPDPLPPRMARPALLCEELPPRMQTPAPMRDSRGTWPGSGAPRSRS